MKPLLLILALTVLAGPVYANATMDAYFRQSAEDMKKENPNLKCGYEKDGSFRCCDPNYYTDCFNDAD